MADLSKDDRLADLLTDMLKRQDRHEAKLDVHTSLLRELLSSNRELVRVVSDLAVRLTDNGTHEVRITDLERSVFGERQGPFQPGPAPKKGPASKGTLASKPKSPKPKPKSKGK